MRILSLVPLRELLRIPDRTDAPQIDSGNQYGFVPLLYQIGKRQVRRV